MEYKALSQKEKNKIVVEFLLAQERDHFCHTINLDRYNGILADPTLGEGEFKAKILELKRDTETRIAEVERIIANTVGQLPSQPEIDAIIAEIDEK